MMHVRNALVLGTLVALLSPLALAQDEMPTPPPQAEDAWLEALVGTWQGTGTMMGMPVTDTLTAGWTLGHQFFVFHSSTQAVMPDGQAMTMEMQMTTKPNGDGTYAGVYMDSWGMMGDYTAHLEEGNMVTEWTDPMEGQQHRAIDTMTPEGGWATTMYTMQPDGSWVEMGSMTYTRAAQ